MIYQFSVFFLNINVENNENPFRASGGKIRLLVLNYPASCVLGSARCSSALCLLLLCTILYDTISDIISEGNSKIITVLIILTFANYCVHSSAFPIG